MPTKKILHSHVRYLQKTSADVKTNLTQQAFIWITNVLEKHQIPYQIAGGLAAIHYGVVRELYDIDIDIPEALFAKILLDVSPYIVYGPERFKDDQWDIYLLTLNYDGQLIDIGGADQTLIFNAKTGGWERLAVDFSCVKKVDLYGKKVSVISRDELIRYKSILNREVDQLDLRFLDNKFICR